MFENRLPQGKRLLLLVSTIILLVAIGSLYENYLTVAARVPSIDLFSLRSGRSIEIDKSSIIRLNNPVQLGDTGYQLEITGFYYHRDDPGTSTMMNDSQYVFYKVVGNGVEYEFPGFNFDGSIDSVFQLEKVVQSQSPVTIFVERSDYKSYVKARVRTSW